MRVRGSIFILLFVAVVCEKAYAADETDSQEDADAKTPCYQELGCFPMSSPWVSLTRPFPPPHDPSRINTKIYFYSRTSSERFNITLWPSISLNDAPFRHTRPATAFIVHGFASSGNESWLADLKDNYLKQVNANVFFVDWGKGASMLNYLQVASNTRIVGAEVARFVNLLINNFYLDPGRIHLMGHSLGAHVCAYVGKRVPGIGRITAFDPAQPGFENATDIVRLDKGDASFVDILHTDSLPFIPFFGFGMIKPYGDVDFYLNGGNLQPGCKSPITIMSEITKETFQPTSIKDLINQSVENISAAVGCSHGRSYLYFTDTLDSPCSLWGQKASKTRVMLNTVNNDQLSALRPSLESCTAETCLPVGLDTPNYDARGMFLVITTEEAPYCNRNVTRVGILDKLSSSIQNTHSRVRSFVSRALKLNGLRNVATRMIKRKDLSTE